MNKELNVDNQKKKKQRMENNEHFMKCNFCQQYFDMRDLGQVFVHEHDDLPEPEYQSSRKAGEAIEWTIDKEPLYLN